MITGIGGVGATAALTAGVGEMERSTQQTDSQLTDQEVTTDSADQAQGGKNVNLDWDREQFRKTLHSQTNVVRQERGLSGVAWNSQLGPIAQSYAETMASAGFVSHTSPDGTTVSDRYQAAGVGCEPMENLFQADWVALQERSSAVRDGRPSYAAIARIVLTRLIRNDMSRQRLFSSQVESAATGVALSGDDVVFVVQDMC